MKASGSMSKRDEAKRLLEHYFSMMWEKAGQKWTSDNSAEVGAIVDFMIDAAREEYKTEHEKNVAKI